MARPKLAGSKDRKIELRVTLEQKEKLRHAAAKQGKRMSTWILDVALQKANLANGADAD
jgi:uncharacterized protein (DUF1778 family)